VKELLPANKMHKADIISLMIFAGVIFAIYAAEAYLIIVAVRNKKRGTSPKRYLSKGAVAVHTLAVTGVMCLIWGFFIEPYWIEVKTVEIPTGKLKHAAVRVVQISDLHCMKKVGNEEKVVEIINSLKPDIIIFTGDSANNIQGVVRFKDTMKRLNASLAKVGVRGNFDSRRLRDVNIFEGTGFTELDAASVELQKEGDKIRITGVTCDKEDIVGEVLKKAPAGDCFSIFLHHFPDLIEDLAGNNIDLYLAGHTHGGQVALPFYGAIITLSKFGKKYESGLYKVGNTLLYVNRGIGMDGPPNPRARFFARPEITVFEIKPK
jgi:predicted MPP superfamily phosphohydrolase